MCVSRRAPGELQFRCRVVDRKWRDCEGYSMYAHIAVQPTGAAMRLPTAPAYGFPGSSPRIFFSALAAPERTNSLGSASAFSSAGTAARASAPRPPSASAAL